MNYDYDIIVRKQNGWWFMRANFHYAYDKVSLMSVNTVFGAVTGFLVLQKCFVVQLT